MPAWQQSDVDQVRAAIVALASGTRVVSISFAGPPARSEAYGTASLDELRRLLAEMERSVSGSPSYRLAEFSKGFDCE